MSFDTSTHIVGNLSADPEYVEVTGGGKVANMTIIANPRVYDHNTKEWKDGAPVPIRCNAWHRFADNVTASLRKGTRVVAVGRLKMNRFVDSKGIERDNLEMDIEAIGPDLRYAYAEVHKAQPKL